MNEKIITRNHRNYSLQDSGFSRSGCAVYDLFLIGSEDADGNHEVDPLFLTSLVISPLEDAVTVAEAALSAL